MYLGTNVKSLAAMNPALLIDPEYNRNWVRTGVTKTISIGSVTCTIGQTSAHWQLKIGVLPCMM